MRNEATRSTPRALAEELDAEFAVGRRADPALIDRLERECRSSWSCPYLDRVCRDGMTVADFITWIGTDTVATVAERFPIGVAPEELLLPGGLAQAVGEHITVEALYEIKSAQAYLDGRSGGRPPLPTWLRASGGILGLHGAPDDVRRWLMRRFRYGWTPLLLCRVFTARDLTFSGFARWVGWQIIGGLHFRLPPAVGPLDLLRPAGFGLGIGLAMAERMICNITDALLASDC